MKIYIDNFKGFSNFEIELNNINIILGKSGSGKTSLLEALFCAGCGTNLNPVWTTILNHRLNGFPVLTNIDLTRILIRSFFCESKPISFILNSSSKVEWSLTEEESIKIINGIPQQQIKIKSIINKDGIEKISYSLILENTLMTKNNSEIETLFKVRFSNQNSYKNFDLESFLYQLIVENDLKKSSEEFLSSYLQSPIQIDYHPHARTILINKQPLAHHGDSLRRLFYFFVMTSLKDDEVYCIDELDSGLDFLGKQLIVDILSKSISSNKKYILATHDSEIIDIILKAFSQKNILNHLTLYNFDNFKTTSFNGIEAYESIIDLCNDLRRSP